MHCAEKVAFLLALNILPKYEYRCTFSSSISDSLSIFYCVNTCDIEVWWKILGLVCIKHSAGWRMSQLSSDNMLSPYGRIPFLLQPLFSSHTIRNGIQYQVPACSPA